MEFELSEQPCGFTEVTLETTILRFISSCQIPMPESPKLRAHRMQLLSNIGCLSLF
jgi:hypothetical protein